MSDLELIETNNNEIDQGEDNIHMSTETKQHRETRLPSVIVQVDVTLQDNTTVSDNLNSMLTRSLKTM